MKKNWRWIAQSRGKTENYASSMCRRWPKRALNSNRDTIFCRRKPSGWYKCEEKKMGIRWDRIRCATSSPYPLKGRENSSGRLEKKGGKSRKKREKRGRREVERLISALVISLFSLITGGNTGCKVVLLDERQETWVCITYKFTHGYIIIYRFINMCACMSMEMCMCGE